MSDFTWTDERVEHLRKLWMEGFSASQVAATLGGVTRNAVIGKIHRLGLSGRGKGSVPAPSAAKPRVAKPKRVELVSDVGPSVTPQAPQPVQEAFVSAHIVDMAPVAAQEPDFPVSERVTIMDLRDSMCRWPIGDPTSPDFRFCGARCSSGAPYCNHHAQIAYQPSSDRRRERRAANG